MGGDNYAERAGDYRGYLASQGRWQPLSAADLTTFNNLGGDATFTAGGLYNARVDTGRDKLHNDWDQSARRLIGTAAADYILGSAGNDRIAGGARSDLLSGGTGSNTLDYSASPSGVIINLAANTAAGDDAAGEHRFFASGTSTIIQADVDGSGVADFEIALVTLVTLVAADFIL